MAVNGFIWFVQWWSHVHSWHAQPQLLNYIVCAPCLSSHHFHRLCWSPPSTSIQLGCIVSLNLQHKTSSDPLLLLSTVSYPWVASPCSFLWLIFHSLHFLQWVTPKLQVCPHSSVAIFTLLKVSCTQVAGPCPFLWLLYAYIVSFSQIMSWSTLARAQGTKCI